MTEFGATEIRRNYSKGWMITFADLLSLMLAFFVLLFAMSKVEVDSWKALVDSLSNRLNPLSEWTRPLLETERAAPELFARRPMDLDYLAGVLQAKMADSEILAKSVLHRLDDRLVVSLPGDLIFPIGHARLLDDSQEALAALGAALKPVGNAIELIGRTEAGAPVDGSPFNSKWDLTLARALSLANGLRAVGYAYSIKGMGAADAGHQDISAELPEGQRNSLSRRIDLVIRETPAQGGVDAP